MQGILATLPVGAVIRERYIIQSLIGKGDSGAVYLVKDLRVKRATSNLFALKEVVGLNKQERSQFTLLAVSLKQLKHQALPLIYRVFDDDKRERVYMLMEYIEGPDLETLWQQQPEQRFSWSEVATLMAPIIDAVGYLHHQDPPIVHGDIKPVNIIAVQPGERTILVDFGIAKASNRDSIAATLHHSSPVYQVPEQYGRDTDVRTDIYELGATFYTLLTGIVPLDSFSRMALLESEQTDPLKPVNVVVPSVPSPVSQAVQRAMSLRANERFSSVEQFWQALHATLQEPMPIGRDTLSTTSSPVGARLIALPEQVQAVAPVTVPSLQRQPRVERSPVSFSKKFALILAVLTLLVGAGISFLSFLQSHPSVSIGAHRSASTATGPSSPTLTGTPSISTPTSAPGNYPSVVGTYTGTLADLADKVSTTIILQGVHQIGGNISGYLTLGSRLQGSGPFSGTIDMSKAFRFTITDASGNPTLFFEGSIQTATSLSGDYYSCIPAQGGVCTRAQTDYGIWSALLV
jgi:eukaryotic-like serine/threonine-protein kinase